MIRLHEADRLSSRERYGLDTLLDLSRILLVEGEADVVSLVLHEHAPGPTDVGSCVANRWYVEVADGEVRMPRAVLATVTDVAGAAAEQRCDQRDRYERVPSGCNPLVAAGREREPVISQAALAIRRAVVAAAGRRPVRLVQPWPDGKRWAVALTHDVDVMRWWPLFLALRIVELAKKGEARRAAAALGAAVATVGRSPLRLALDHVLQVEAAHDVRSTWFFLCGPPTMRTMAAGDLTYSPDSRPVLRLLADLTSRSHEVGLHGSFETMTSAEAFARQRALLERLSGRPASGVRQHYLRMRPGATQRAMRGAGFRYDATFGFPDRNGFRLGAADVVRGWDESAEQATDLEMVPLTWMDRALSKYAGIENPAAWIADARHLARLAREVEGLWVGLWHPNLTPALGYPGAPDAFRDLVDGVISENPWAATLEEICRWRRRRRGVRAAGILPDGTVAATADRGHSEPPALEDATGRRCESVTVRSA